MSCALCFVSVLFIEVSYSLNRKKVGEVGGWGRGGGLKRRPAREDANGKQVLTEWDDIVHEPEMGWTVSLERAVQLQG